MRSRVLWGDVYDKLFHVVEEAARKGRVDIVKEARKLIKDLEMWDPSEEVCYDEFYSRISRLKAMLRVRK
ncbi:hypothetical protein [Alphaspiravirus yamagawaense]|uniref:Uncharacterized protein n=1 Tax=Alphaspiravirus yamagawaense TaxID=1157339 RepID=J7QC68_9VIRU|nr:hypothetical protein [Aeropyrum coil-shaped virus]CCG27844.1 hypothetical protein [Aeropyrum coil-shaped virus]